LSKTRRGDPGTDRPGQDSLDAGIGFRSSAYHPAFDRSGKSESRNAAPLYQEAQCDCQAGPPSFGLTIQFVATLALVAVALPKGAAGLGNLAESMAGYIAAYDANPLPF
jgi:hypothetical protein